MVMRYLARRDNPWEILPGIALIITKKPVLLFSSTTKSVRGYLTAYPPGVAHLIGVVVAAIGLFGIWLYFYAKGYTGPKTPSSLHSTHSSNQTLDRSAGRSGKNVEG